MAFMAFNLGEWDGIIHSWLVFPANHVWLPVGNHPMLGGLPVEIRFPISCSYKPDMLKLKKRGKKMEDTSPCGKINGKMIVKDLTFGYPSLRLTNTCTDPPMDLTYRIRPWLEIIHQPQTKLSWSQAPFLAESHIRPWLWVILSTRHVMWQHGRRELQI
jgi:hypothetical protein